MKVKIDSLVRGKRGSTEHMSEMRVFHISRWGWVAGIDSNTGRQTIMAEFEVVDKPRPVAMRTDIPARLQ